MKTRNQLRKAKVEDYTSEGSVTVTDNDSDESEPYADRKLKRSEINEKNQGHPFRSSANKVISKCIDQPKKRQAAKPDEAENSKPE